MDAATHIGNLDSLIRAAGMTAFAEDCDRIVIRRSRPAHAQATFVEDSDFGPTNYEQ